MSLGNCFPCPTSNYLSFRQVGKNWKNKHITCITLVQKNVQRNYVLNYYVLYLSFGRVNTNSHLSHRQINLSQTDGHHVFCTPQGSGLGYWVVKSLVQVECAFSVRCMCYWNNHFTHLDTGSHFLSRRVWGWPVDGRISGEKRGHCNKIINIYAIHIGNLIGSLVQTMNDLINTRLNGQKLGHRSS